MAEAVESDPGECSIVVKKRKRLRCDRKLLEGEEVEVRLFEEGLKGSWHKAVVVKCEECVRWVKYNEILADDNSSQLVESITVTKAVDGLTKKPRKRHRGCIRPFPPCHDINDSKITYGTCVDCLIEDVWWEGVIFDKEEGSPQRTVFFPDQGDRHTIDVNMMRCTFDWNEISGDWQPRGTWTFLKLLGKLEKKGPFPISIREIWYDVSCTEIYHKKIGEWVCGSLSTWRHLVNAAIKEAHTVALGQSHNPGVVVLPTDSTDNDWSMDGFRTDNLGMATQHLETGANPMAIDNVSGDFSEKAGGGHFIAQCLRECSSRKQFKNKKGVHFEITRRRRRRGGCLGTSMRKMEVFSGCSVNKRGVLDLVVERDHRSSPKYFKGTRNNRRSAKKHLLSIGWKIMKFGCGIDYFVSPDGKRYSSLLAACEACTESEIRSTTETHGGSGNLMIDNQFSEHLNKREAKADESAPVSEDAFPWEPVDVEADYCHEYIVSYAQYLENGKSWVKNCAGTTAFNLGTARLNVKKHLVALGWRIFVRDESHGLKKMRYCFISPKGLRFSSLTKVVPHLINSGEYRLIDDVSARQGQHGSESVCALDVSDGETFVSKDRILESHREAMLDYINCLERKHSKVSGVFSEEAKMKRLKVKKHLLCLGWTFFYIDKNGVKELRYSSPEKKRYSSLLKACKDSLDQLESKRAEALTDGTAAVKKGSYPPPEHKPKITIKIHTSANESDTGSEMASILNKFRNKRVNRVNDRINDTLLSSLSSGGMHDALDETCSALNPNHQKTKKRKTSGKSSTADTATKVLVPRLSKQARVVTSSPSQHVPRSVLSWLIENGVVQPRQKVRYLRKRDGHVLMEGRIAHGGIKCNCCNQVLTLSTFESHAGSSNHRPAANIFLLDGRSLLECQRQVMQRAKPKDFPHKRVKSDYSLYPSDAICSLCQDGGTLVLCDHCPSSFHLSCVGLEVVPEGKWFCPSCQCSICGLGEFNSDSKKFTPETKLFCDQCECEYHVGCLQENGLSSLTRCPEGYWFCSKICSEIFGQLHKLVGKSNSISVGDFTWTILRAKNENDLAFGTNDKDAKAEEHSKLHLALEVLHECFLNIIEPRTGTDLIEDLLYNKESELNRLNFWGFYTIVLEKGDEVVSVATFRVYGNKVAEMPLVGTRLQYRRKGMCRLLINELEKLLYSMGVERLLLPAVPELLKTWTESFGFTVMTQSDKLMLSRYTFLGFQSTTMCQKILRPPEELIGKASKVEETVNAMVMDMDFSDDIVTEAPEMVLPITVPCVLAVDSNDLPSLDITKKLSINSSGSYPITSCSKNIGILQEDGYGCLQKELKDQTFMNTSPVEIDGNYGFPGTETNSQGEIGSRCLVGDRRGCVQISRSKWHQQLQ